MSKKRKSAGKTKIRRTSLAYYRFAYANEQEVKISRISLAYHRFAFANEQEAEIGRTSRCVAVGKR